MRRRLGCQATGATLAVGRVGVERRGEREREKGRGRAALLDAGEDEDGDKDEQEQSSAVVATTSHTPVTSHPATMRDTSHPPSSAIIFLSPAATAVDSSSLPVGVAVHGEYASPRAACRGVRDWAWRDWPPACAGPCNLIERRSIYPYPAAVSLALLRLSPSPSSIPPSLFLSLSLASLPVVRRCAAHRHHRHASRSECSFRLKLKTRA